MDATEIRSLMSAVAPVVRDFVEEAMSPLVARAKAAEQRAAALEQRLAELEARELPEAIKGEDGKSVTAEDVAPMIASEVEKAVAKIELPKDGKDGADIVDFVRGENGHVVVTMSNGTTRDLGSFKGDPGERGPEGPEGPKGEAGERGADGAHAAIEEVIEAVAPLLAEEAQKAVSAIPAPKDGTSVTVDDVAPLITSEVEKAVAAIPPPKDGAPGPQGEKGDPGHDVEDITVTQEGRIVELSFTVGDVRSIFELELPEGPPGEDGADGRGITKTDIDQHGELSVTYSDGTVEKAGPVKGEKGEPGADGLGFEDMEETLDGREVVRTYRRGDEVKEFRFRLPIPEYKGAYREGAAYEKNDMITYGGSTWIAMKDTSGKPEKSPDWKLCAKRGRDGKPGKDAA